nr:amino acid permease [Acidobacteriota bacterium]
SLQVVAQGILGSALPASTVSPLADAAGASMGGWARALLLAGAAISMFGHIGGMTLAMPRMIYAFARDGFLPRALGAVHPRTQAPVTATVLHVSIVFALAVSGSFEKLAILANVSAMALYLGCAAAAWQLRRMGVAAGASGGFRVPFGAVIPWLAGLVIVWMLTSLTRGEWIAIAACIAGASAIYAATRTRAA